MNQGCRFVPVNQFKKTINRKEKTMKQLNTPTPPNRREHLFSPHTSLCIYCGQNAQDDAIDSLPCGYDEAPPCEACGDKGWLLVENSDHSLRFERCDACQKFESDEAALKAVAKAAEAQPALLKFVKEISELNHEKEPGEDGTVSERPSDLRITSPP
jgi:hypothetical protein